MDQVRAVPSVVTTKALTSFVLSVPVSREIRLRRDLDRPHHNRPPEPVSLLTEVVCVNMRTQSDVELCTVLIGSSKKESRSLPAPNDKVFVPCLCIRIFSSQQKSPAGIRKPAGVLSAVM